jgi:succinyl-CoA synthetase beta subunit
MARTPRSTTLPHPAEQPFLVGSNSISEHLLTGVIRRLRDLRQPSTEVRRAGTRLRLHLQIIYNLDDSSDIAGDLLGP